MPTFQAENIAPPITSGLKGSGHQVVGPPSSVHFPPSHFTPVPVAANLQGGTLGTAYSESITAQGGTAPYTFAVTSGALPTGTSMSSGGNITGTPTVTGTYTFTVTVTDSHGFTGSQAFQIVISAPPVSNYGFIA